MSLRIGAITLRLSLGSLSGMALGLLGCWSTVDIECGQSGRCIGAESVAPFVFGQPDEHTQLGFKLGLNRPTHAVLLGKRLFIADQGNHRVLIRDSTSLMGPDSDSYQIVLGQPDLTTGVANYGGLSASSLNLPHSLATDGTRLVVADSGNHRVLIWSSIPTRNGQPADIVVGQPDMTSGVSAVSDRSLGDAPDVALGAGLFVIDKGNHRALLWRTIPTQNFQPADVVIGQTDKDDNAANHGQPSPDAIGLFSPSGAPAVTGGRLMVADSGNHRVLAWNPIPPSDGLGSQLVLGQADLVSSLPNRGSSTPTQSSLLRPTGVAISSGQDSLAVADGNNRVLLWTTFPTMNGQAASYVLGQPGFFSETENNGGVGAASMSGPEGLSFEADDLYVADTGNSRVLHFAAPLASSGQAAARVFGQPDFTGNRPNSPGPISATTLVLPLGVSGGGDRLAVSDFGNSRVLLFNQIPHRSGDLPSLALGQPDFGSSLPGHGAGPSGNGFVLLGSIWTDGTRLAVADSHRVLIWLTWPTSGLQPADLVLGQPDMVTNIPNNGGVSASSLATPRVVESDGTRLFVADRDNHRILIWNTFPTVSRQPADRVLGQPDMTSSSGSILCYTHPPASAQTLNCPHGLASDGNQLYVADVGNYRVLLWNRMPTVNGQAADVVLGKSNFSATELPTVATASNFGEPNRMLLAKGRIYVSDYPFNRVLYWNAPPTQNGQPADGVIGQPDFTSLLVNNGGLSFSSLSSPHGLFATPDRLFIVDQGNQRVIAIRY